MRVKARWIKGVIEEADKMQVRMPFERGQRRAAIRNRVLTQKHAFAGLPLAS